MSIFAFPYPPYPSQLDFCTKLHSCLVNSLSGIFQSPTGTGKTLSLILAALQWVHTAVASDVYNTENREKWAFGGDFEDIEPISGLIYEPRVVFCMRTHTQISQFIKEIRLTTVDQSNILALAAKKRLCIHPESANHSDISEFCSNINKSPSKCPYKADFSSLTDQILTSVMDIEDLKVAGKVCGQCPYYAMRAGIPHSKVIIAPYQYILSRSIREKVPLANEDTAIIIDEAHNVIDTVLMCNSTERKITTLDKINEFLAKMIENARNLQGNLMENLEDVERNEIETEKNTIFEDLESAKKVIEAVKKAIFSTNMGNNSSFCYFPTDFLSICDLNPSNLLDLSQRLRNYTWEFWRVSLPISNSSEKTVFLSPSSLEKLLNSLDLIANLSFDPENHRLILYKKDGKITKITHLLVNPIKEFESILKTSKSVILTGGTLDPKDEFVRLFSSLPANKVVIYDFDHVVPETSLLLSIITHSNVKKMMKLDYCGCRKEENLIAICEIIEKICEIVPNGVVCFFPSFDFLRHFWNFSSQSGFQSHFLQLKIVIFDDHLSAFSDYQRASLTPRGALLFTVVRGSLSEGINFKHEIGRCVVVIGQPYPNTHDADVQAKMDFWDRDNGEVTGRVYLVNSCFKAVNQCVGRVVRDREDYAVAVLVDGRYRWGVEKLAGWTRRNMVMGKENRPIFDAIRGFFEGKRRLEGEIMQ